ncbi:MAG TPA: twin-arginine translocation signal domain-containing protein [Alphaproteobacteria bacterium]|nr:twin-arginine translocation signal domain-containing protein [Alphaproteobacteria bacterium]
MKTSSTQHENAHKDRRAFLKKAGTAAAAVPAAAVLLSLSEKSALAQSQSGGTRLPS